MSKRSMKNAARIAIARQTWKGYLYPGRKMNVAETLIPKVQAMLRRANRGDDVFSALATIAGQNVIAQVLEGDPLQAESVFRSPELEAIHFLGMDGELWASDVEFFPYR